jgi:phage-related protein
MNNRGDTPVKKYLTFLSAKARTKVMAFIALLEKKGPTLKRPYADILRDGIRELRIHHSSNQYRILYFFILRNKIILTHGFTKKTDKVPEHKIDSAIRIKKDISTKCKKGEIAL